MLDESASGVRQADTVPLLRSPSPAASSAAAPEPRCPRITHSHSTAPPPSLVGASSPLHSPDPGGRLPAANATAAATVGDTTASGDEGVGVGGRAEGGPWRPHRPECALVGPSCQCDLFARCFAAWPRQRAQASDFGGCLPGCIQTSPQKPQRPSPI